MASRGDRVAIAWVHGKDNTYSWHQSMMALIAYDVAHHQRVLEAGWFATKYGSGGLIQARNDTVASFLAEAAADWLMWIDTDMGFSPDSIDRLHDAADADERPVVGGLCFMMQELAPDGLGGYLTQPLPTVYDWVRTDEGLTGFQSRTEYERDTLTKADATGSAFILCHRSAFEAVEAEYGRTWYSPVKNEGGTTLSEDLSFCTRLAAVGLPLYVDTRVKTSHMKSVWVDERLYDRVEMIGKHAYTPGS